MRESLQNHSGMINLASTLTSYLNKPHTREPAKRVYSELYFFILQKRSQEYRRK